MDTMETELKPAFAKDESFLADVRRVLAERGAGVWWLGQSGFLVAQNGRALISDPYLSDSLTRKYAGTAKPHVRMTERVVDPAALGALGVIDVITSSHQHTDHFDAETLRPLLSANPQARLVLPAAIGEFAIERLGPEAAARLVELDEGQSARVGELEFHGIAAAHNTVERDALGRCRFLGYVVEWAGLTFYHSGDTLLHDGLVPALRRFNMDLAFLPINGSEPERGVAGNLSGKEAARLAHAAGARQVIPCHYDSFEFNTAPPDEFIAECRALGQPCQVLRQGEGWFFQGSGMLKAGFSEPPSS
jgi:L-ascorbate metabolism protein UlaG (beta-lactamase superfamily)